MNKINFLVWRVSIFLMFGAANWLDAMDIESMLIQKASLAGKDASVALAVHYNAKDPKNFAAQLKKDEDLRKLFLKKADWNKGSVDERVATALASLPVAPAAAAGPGFDVELLKKTLEGKGLNPKFEELITAGNLAGAFEFLFQAGQSGAQAADAAVGYLANMKDDKAKEQLKAKIKAAIAQLDTKFK